ncbi:T9SS type A sorting domain-containing protein [Candidatus Poribacteria bacterium]|nr:T9SS type A sorting domain-containing protein [Candidatus Poribacteria bacterium]MYH83461.1 T9SS type A sorting domain-containing protein [Candidatus Poribacteria bacterium]MYK95874.1 T9SS type A sorting domain-containing protein [Candidatus Poribacteria bacterium]
MLRKFRKSHILFLIVILGLVSLGVTNGFAIPEGLLEGDFEFPTADGAAYIQGNAEFQRVPNIIFGTNDFEKMRDFPPNSRDYILGRKVGLFFIPSRDGLRGFICTGFLVGPDLFMTNHHCIHDEDGLLPLEGAAIFMDYYQEEEVDETLGGLTARVSGIVQMDELKDYALLRLDRPLGNTYGWLELDTTTRVDSDQSVKLISHPAGRSKEIVRNNTEIVDLPPAFTAELPFIFAYLADSEGGASGSPVFLRDGTGVIGIHHSAWTNRFTGEPLFNAGSLMSHILPEIEQHLPAPAETASDLVVEAVWVNTDAPIPGASFTLSVIVRNRGGVAASPTNLWFYQSFDNSITPFDIELGSRPMDALAPAATSEVSFTVTAPSAGTSYYGAGVDLVANEAFTNNNYSTGVKVTVQPSTTPPLIFNPPTIADQTFPVDTLITPLALPAATGGIAPYRYTLSPIPNGLDFNAATRLLTGTPTTVGTTNATYTTMDAGNNSDSLNFTITVIGQEPPVEPPVPPPGSPLDVNDDGQVNTIDLAIVALFYGTQVPVGISLPADVNADAVVDILDLTAVAQGIDAANSTTQGFSLEEIEAVLAVVAEQAAEIEAVAGAPNALSRGNLTYRNVTAALTDAKRLATSDVRLEKGIPVVLEELLQLLTEMKAIPETSALLPNYPNPFNPETWIPYHLATDAKVTLTIYDVRGSVVRTLTLGHQPAGVYQSRGRAAYWDGKNRHGEPVASGVYFYTLTAGDFTATRKLLIIK